MDEDPGVGEDRRQQISAALRTSGLGEYGATSSLETYGCTFVVAADIQRATANACTYLGEYSRSTRFAGISGPASISARDISANFIAMSNLIPAFASAQGRAYTRQELKDWKLVVTHLWALLKARNGKKYDALVMPSKLRKDLKTDLSRFYSDVENIAFFFTYADPSYPNPCFDDLDMLLAYLTRRCYVVQRGRVEMADRARHAGSGAPPRTGPLRRDEPSCVIM